MRALRRSAIPSGSPLLPWQGRWSSRLSIPTKCFVRDLVDGQEVDAVFVVRARNRRQKRNGERLPEAPAGRRHRRRSRASSGTGSRTLDPVCEGGAIVRVLGRYSVDERYGAGITVRRMRAAADGEYELADLAEAPPIPYRQMAADLQSLVETVQRPHLRELLDRLIDRGLPRGAGGQVLPPGLPPRAARALPVGGPGRERAGGHVPGHRPRRGGHRRAAARHRQGRGLRLSQRRDRADRRRQAARRDPARLLPRAARDRGASRASPRRTPTRCCTSSSATTASSSTAARWCPARARPRSCT